MTLYSDESPAAVPAEKGKSGESAVADKEKPQPGAEKISLDGVKPSIKNVAFELEKLLRPSDFTKNVMKTYAAPAYLKIINGKNGRSTLIYRCRYAKSKSILNGLESVVSATGTVEESESQNLIIVSDAAEHMEDIKTAVLSLDIFSPQVLVEAKVVEVLLGEGQQRDIDVTFNRHDAKQNLNSTTGISTNTSNITSGEDFNWYPYISGETGDSVTKNLNTTIKWLISANDAKVLSAPNLIVSLNATASIVTGQDIPIQTIQVVSGSTTTSTEFKRVGVTLNVTPKLINDTTVSLEVNPQVSNVLRYENITQGDGSYPVPVIAIRNIQTELTLGDGQIIMLGGLYSYTEKKNEERTPFLSDIPYIGEAFTGKNETKELTQLIFFLKISILSQEQLDSGIIYDPGRQAETMRKVGDLIQNAPQIFPDKNKLGIEKTKDELMDAAGTVRFEEAISGTPKADGNAGKTSDGASGKSEKD